MRIEDILNDESLDKTKNRSYNDSNLDQLNNNNNIKKSDEDEEERLMDIKSLLKLQDEEQQQEDDDDEEEADLEDKKEAGGTIPDVLLHELDRIIIESSSGNTTGSLSSSSGTSSSSDEDDEEDGDEEDGSSITSSSAYERYSPLCVIVEEDEEEEEEEGHEEDDFEDDCASSCSSDATITEATVASLSSEKGESGGSRSNNSSSNSSSSSSSNGSSGGRSSSEGGDDDKEIDSSCDDDGVGSFRHARTRGTGISTLTTNNSPVCCPEPQQPPPEESGAREKDQKESISSNRTTSTETDTGTGSSSGGGGYRNNHHQIIQQQPPASEYFVIKFLAQEQQRQLDLIDLSKLCSISDINNSNGEDLNGGKQVECLENEEDKNEEESFEGESYNDHNYHESKRRKYFRYRRRLAYENSKEEDNEDEVDDEGGEGIDKIVEKVGGENGLKELSRFIEENTAGSYFDLNNCEQDNNYFNGDEEEEEVGRSEEVNIQIKDLQEICIENKTSDKEMHQRLSSSASVVVCGTVGNDPNSATQPHILAHLHVPSTKKPRSVLRKPSSAGVKRHSRNVTFNESLNLFYEAECQCWIHEDDYARLRQEEQAQSLYEHALHAHAHHHQQQQHQQQQLPGHHHHHHFIHNPHYDPPPLEFEDTPTLSPPEGYKDRFFPQHDPHPPLPPGIDPDVTRVSPPSPPAARRKIFLKDGLTESQYEEQLQAHLAHHMATQHHQQHHHQQHPPQQHQQQRPPILNGLDEEEDEDGKKKGSRFGGILKGGRLWRSNSSESKKVVTSPSEEPDVVKCTEKDARLPDKDGQSQGINSVQIQTSQSSETTQSSDSSGGVVYGPTKVSTGTATLRTSEQIRLAVDSTLRLSRSKKNKQECSSSLVEKLRWLTSLDDDDSSDSQSGFATWPSRDKNGLTNPSSGNSSTSSSGGGGRKSDAGTSTSDQEFVLSAIRHPPSIASANEAKIKQISYTLEDIDEGLKGGENELETFITEDGARIERIRKRYGSEDIGGDDYGFSRRPSVKGIKPKFSSTNQIFAQFTAMRAGGAETPIPQMMSESQYENTREIQNIQQLQMPPQSHYEPLPIPQQGQPGPGIPNTVVDGVARVNLNYDQYPPNTSANNNGATLGNPNATPVPGRSAEESRSHFEMIRQSFEQASYVNYNRPHSWSVSTLPHPHHHGNNPQQQSQQQSQMVPGPGQHIPLPGMTNNLSGSSLSIMSQAQQNQNQMVVVGPPQGQPQQPQNNLSTGQQSNGMMMNGPPGNPNNGNSNNTRPNSMPMMPQQQQPLYGTLPGNASQQQQQMMGQQPIYGTVRRVPNVIGRPLFLHYGALSVEAHPNKLVQPYPSPQANNAGGVPGGVKVPETPSPTQQPPPIKYYGPPIRYYNPPPPVPPRSATTTIGTGPGPEGSNCIGGVPLERGNPEGATDEEPSIKEPAYAMNV